MGRKKSSSNNHGMRGQHPEYREILAELTSRHRQLSDGEGFEVVRRQEEVELLLRSGRYEEAHAAAVSLLQERPDFLPAANNLSLLQWILGNPEAAIETAGRVLSLDGANLHALANLSRFLSSEGKKEEALEYGGRLKGIHPSSFLETYKKMEGLAFLGDDRGVADLFENAEEEPVFRDE